MIQRSPVKDQDVASTIYQHQERIYRYVLTLVNNPAEADDLTQDALLRAFHSYDSLREPAALTSWLYRIATHVCYDRLRRRLRRAPHRSDLDPETVAIPESDQPSLSHLVERGEMSACVQGFLEGLTDPYRAVILLHDMHGMTGPEIAAALGISLPTVKIRIHRARVKLRAALGEGCDFSRDVRGVLVCDPRLEAEGTHDE